MTLLTFLCFYMHRGIMTNIQTFCQWHRSLFRLFWLGCMCILCSEKEIFFVHRSAFVKAIFYASKGSVNFSYIGKTFIDNLFLLQKEKLLVCVAYASDSILVSLWPAKFFKQSVCSSSYRGKLLSKPKKYLLDRLAKSTLILSLSTYLNCRVPLMNSAIGQNHIHWFLKNL